MGDLLLRAEEDQIYPELDIDSLLHVDRLACIVCAPKDQHSEPHFESWEATKSAVEFLGLREARLLFGGRGRSLMGKAIVLIRSEDIDSRGELLGELAIVNSAAAAIISHDCIKIAPIDEDRDPWSLHLSPLRQRPLL